ncbi:MAG: GNAT family N-acetyltransferase [Dehalococcoidia bacterium]
MDVPEQPLRARNFVLRHWDPDDADWYVSARDEEVYRWTTEPRELAVETLRAVIERNRREPAWVGLAITDAVTGEIIGNIALRPESDAGESAEVTYWLAPQGRGRGAATESVRALCAWAFTSTPVVTITLRTDPDNHASQAVAQRAGFTLQGRDGDRYLFELRRA